VLFPRIKIEKFEKIKISSNRRWSWRGFTYKKGGGRYFYMEALQLIGIATIILVAILFAFIVHK